MQTKSIKTLSCQIVLSSKVIIATYLKKKQVTQHGISQTSPKNNGGILNNEHITVFSDCENHCNTTVTCVEYIFFNLHLFWEG